MITSSAFHYALWSTIGCLDLPLVPIGTDWCQSMPIGTNCQLLAADGYLRKVLHNTLVATGSQFLPILWSVGSCQFCQQTQAQEVKQATNWQGGWCFYVIYSKICFQLKTPIEPLCKICIHLLYSSTYNKISL